MYEVMNSLSKPMIRNWESNVSHTFLSTYSWFRHRYSSLQRLCYCVYSASQPVMFLIALILTGFAVGGLCADEPHQVKSLEEPVFGIEFSMENIMISFAPPGGHAKGLATVKGDIAYQNLIGSYFEICSETRHTQTPPWTYKEYRAIMAREYQTRTILRPDLLDWYDWSQFQVQLSTLR